MHLGMLAWTTNADAQHAIGIGMSRRIQTASVVFVCDIARG